MKRLNGAHVAAKSKNKLGTRDMEARWHLHHNRDIPMDKKEIVERTEQSIP